MSEPLTFEQFFIEVVDTAIEINYIIKDGNGYVCRLVPGEAGFELSPADKAVDNIPEQNLIERISNFIVIQHA
jgi:hypothetical protein